MLIASFIEHKKTAKKMSGLADRSDDETKHVVYTFKQQGSYLSEKDQEVAGLQP